MTEETEDPKPPPARRGYRNATPVLSGFVVIYFLFPYALLWPLLLVYGKNSPPPPGLRVAFAPVIYLDQHVPAYRALLEKEADWLRLR